MADIFLSYDSEDRDRVRPLVAALESLSWSVFWDFTIPAGLTWDRHIGTELKKARSVVVVWSRASVESEYVREEAKEGHSRRILIPVRLNEVEPPFGFRLLQSANLAEWDGDMSAPGFQALIEGLERVVGPAPSSAPMANARGVAGRTDVQSGLSPTATMGPRLVPDEQWAVAFSFAGAQREMVRELAIALERMLGPSTVFFDEWYEFYTAGNDADLLLRSVYREKSILVVVCVSQEYEDRLWVTGEFEEIRSRARSGLRRDVFPIRVGEGDVEGFRIDTGITPDVRGRSPEETAQLIVSRLRLIEPGWEGR